MIPNLYRFVNILSAFSFLQREKIAIFPRIFPTIPDYVRKTVASVTGFRNIPYVIMANQCRDGVIHSLL